jgi:hypothetical protein
LAITPSSEGFRKLNGELVPIVNKELTDHLARDGFAIPTAKVQQVVGDFLNQHRTLIDPNTGQPYRGLLGNVKKFEPDWNPDDFRAHLKAHLFEDMPQKPNAGQMNRIVNDITGTSRERVRGILDGASDTVDSALFSWRNTVGDEYLGKATLFHYWMSRQGGLYVSEGMAHPWIAAAYGRMMQEMSDQAEEIGLPDWMQSYFQFAKSVGGFSTWFSPFDIMQSLMTMADWQRESGDDPFTDLTKLGQGVSAIPFFVHPGPADGGLHLRLLGPDYPAPPVSGVETFGSRAINLMNLGNAQGAGWMKPFNAMGIGVDAAGNPIPINPKPLQMLYGEVGNAISSILQPITGLSPVEVQDFTGGITRDVQTIGEQEIRKQHPEWDDGSDAGQMAIDNAVTTSWPTTATRSTSAGTNSPPPNPINWERGRTPSWPAWRGWPRRWASSPAPSSA